MRVIENGKHLLGVTLAILPASWLVNAPSTRTLNIAEVDPIDAKALVEMGALVLDVRGQEAFAARHIPGATLIPLGALRGSVADKIYAVKDRPIVVYCGDGVRSGPEATAILNQIGFSNAVNLRGGLEGWQRAGLQTATGNG